MQGSGPSVLSWSSVYGLVLSRGDVILIVFFLTVILVDGMQSGADGDTEGHSYSHAKRNVVEDDHSDDQAKQHPEDHAVDDVVGSVRFLHVPTLRAADSSLQGLIDQLVFKGYTQEQAEIRSEPGVLIKRNVRRLVQEISWAGLRVSI